MGTQGVGTFQINSKFSSGNLIFYEKAVGRTTTGDVLTIGTAAVTVGGTAQAVDFKFYATGSISAILAAAGTLTLVGIATSTNGAVTITNATASTTTGTGALIVSGGVGIAKGLFVGEVVSVGTVCQPDTSDGAALGTSSLMWSDLFLASGGVINFNNGDVTITHASNTLTLAGGNLAITGNLAVTDTALNATTGRVGKFTGSVAAPNQGDGYGVFEVDVTASGTFAGTTNAFSSWLNVAASAVPGGNLICAQNNGIYLPTGITASSAKMVMGMRMHYVADDGANPGSLYCFSTNIYSNVLTAIFDVNAIVDLGGSTGAQTGNDYKIPLLKDASAGVTWYVNVYHS